MFRSRRQTKEAEKDLDLLPVMNLFSILIPFLISMAVFQKMAVVDIFMEPQNSSPHPEPSSVSTEDLALTLALNKHSLEVWARGGSLPKIFTKEIVEVRCKSDGESHRHDRNTEKVIRCLDGTLATPFDIETFHLFKLERSTEADPGQLVKVLRNANDSVYLNRDRAFVFSKEHLPPRSFLQTLNPNSIVKMEGSTLRQAKLDYLSAFDELALVLQDLNQKFIDLPDSDKIVILADDKIEFDKIIQAMDVAKASGFANVQLAKLAL